jgi:hypothetical protein
MTEITVTVPDDKVGEFYVVYGQWLQSVAGQNGKAAIHWSAADINLAVQVWKKLPANSRQVIAILVGVEELDAASLAEDIGLKDVSQLTGVNGWIGRISNEFGRRTPVKAKASDKGTAYWMEPGVAELFKKAMKQ